MDTSQSNPVPKAQSTLWKYRCVYKDCKSQMIGEFAVRLFPGNIRNYTRKVSPTQLPKFELDKDDCQTGCGKAYKQTLYNPTQKIYQ